MNWNFFLKGDGFIQLKPPRIGDWLLVCYQLLDKKIIRNNNAKKERIKTAKMKDKSSNTKSEI